ncbi:FEN1-like nuclease [Yokapox virus]|uniref:FEN1-like nuclease n=1 Tax=Yokapox virus TaxID=1076255 RepID=G3EID9_9POXV|nr:FEN1-like nuclease [Yokapox virus]AEN03650.1 FEN1-like nuclease [Yokapox virus]
MGIKNLKKLLIKNNSLVLIEDDKDLKYNGVFVDTMSIYIAVANCYTNMKDIINVFRKYINRWIKIGNHVTLFVDKGSIFIKEPIRDKRRKSSKLTKERKCKDIENIKLKIENIKTNESFNEEQLTDMQLKIDKLSFQIYLLDSNNIKTSLNTLLSTFEEDNNISIVYCDNRDAEFVMCYEAKKQLYDKGEWPLLISTDQDTMLFTSTDYHPKMIKTLTQLFRFIPTSEDAYLSKLTVLLNGCDFFPGLYGTSLTTDNIDKIKIFNEFTLDNILTSLVFKNYYKKNNTYTNIDIYKIIKFINNYANMEDDVYSEDTPSQCSIHDFIFSGLNERWNVFKESYIDNIPVTCQLMYSLTPRKNIVENEVKKLVNYIDLKNNILDINIIKDIAFIFGYNTDNNSNIKVLGIYNNKLFLSFNSLFYFNDKSVISCIKSDNIIHIGY